MNRMQLNLPLLEAGNYKLQDEATVLTPALAIYPEIVRSNIEFTLKLMDGDGRRWRPHIKTAKLESIIRMYRDYGVPAFKCSTTLELLVACRLAAPDVLIAYPVVGANARRVCQIADQYPDTQISVLVESEHQVEAWVGSRVGLFIDLNPGMNRTGIEEANLEAVIGVARAVIRSGQTFRGLHYYDGHLGKYELVERERLAHSGYDNLLATVDLLESAGVSVQEVITAGTPAFPATLSYGQFRTGSFTHRASPGTVVYSDCTSLAQLPSHWEYRPAAVVVSTVVSRPSAGRITCDAGHKTVSADAGSPTCAVIGRSDLIPSKPSEEHLPIDSPDRGPLPRAGDVLYLVPRHVCPTINNFDYALMVRDGRIDGLERVSARGREAPILEASLINATES